MSADSTTLGNLAAEGVLELSDGYRTKRSELGQPGIPILRVAEVLDGRITPTYKDHVRLELRPAFHRKTSRTDDVILTTKGTVGRVARVPSDAPEFVYSPQVCFFRVVDRERLDSGWLYYWFKGSQFRTQALRVQDQTDMAPYINLVDLRRTRIVLPPLSEQRAIAEVLGTVDDKIENSRTIAERAAKLALTQGQAILADPRGPIVSLPSVASMSKGVSYRSEDLVEGGRYLVSLKCVGRDGTFQLHGLKPYSGDYRSEQVVEHGDVVVAQTDLTQRAEVIGRPVRVQSIGTKSKLVASLDLIIVRPQGSWTRETLLSLLSTQDFRDHALSYCNGTTVLHMGARCLPDYRFRLPTDDALVSATAIMRPLLERADSAERERLVAAELRDVLLPRLLSGELQVRQAEKLVEEAV
jgi:type I restriction enzyme, S subunit